MNKSRSPLSGRQKHFCLFCNFLHFFLPYPISSKSSIFAGSNQASKARPKRGSASLEVVRSKRGKERQNRIFTSRCPIYLKTVQIKVEFGVSHWSSVVRNTVDKLTISHCPLSIAN